MNKHEVFYALCDLFNEGTTSVEVGMTMNVIEAAKHALPTFDVRAGLLAPDGKTQILHVDNYEKVK